MRLVSPPPRYARRPLRRALAFWSAGLLVGLLTLDAAAQFNARGRGPRTGGGTARTTTVQPKAPPQQTAAQRRDTLIARYEKLIFSQPGEDVPITRLAELVRKRDGNLDKLLKKLSLSAQTHPDRYAALIAWGGILSKDGQESAAAAKLAEASGLQPQRPEAWKLLGEIQKSTGNKKAARSSFERAVPRVSGPERSLLIRTLRDLSLDLGDYEAASQHHQKLVNEAKGNLFLKGELGRQLLERGQTERAVAELERVVKSAHGDSRALAPALRDLGQAQVAAKKTTEAIATLKRASRLAVASPGLRTAIDTLRAEAHRKDGSLDEFLKELSTTAGSAPRLGLLGRLQEEAGNSEKAAQAYEKALQLSPRDIDLRLRLVRLYEVTGNIEGAVQQYGRLVQSAPRDVQLSLRYAEMLLAQGERDKAVRELDRIDRLTASDPEAGLLLLDFADRLEEHERSKRILARLARAGSRDPRFLVELGARHYQAGDTTAARRTWKKILVVHSDRAAGHLLHGEVLIDHEAASDGVKELRKAAELKPSDIKVKKALALGLERAATQATPRDKNQFEKEALQAWHQLLKDTTSADAPSVEQTRSLARRHIVRLWKRRGQLAGSLAPLQAALSATPPDLDAGRLLAEGHLATRADRRAIAVLEKILEHAPGDRPSLLALESAHTRVGDYEAAIRTLEKLVEADPRRSREYYERMARAAALRNDQGGALRFAELAVEKSPSDPAAQASLGDLYLAQGRLKDAEKAYRKALTQDDRLHHVSLKLADVLTKTNRAEQALDVLFHVTRSSRDPEAIGLSARRAISVSVPLGQERLVEEVLRPLAIGHPEQPLYRSLLLEVLSSQMYPLMLASAHGDESQRKSAAQNLQQLADRSTGPLLAALSSQNAGQQQVAISLLAHSKTRSAGSGLLAFAEGSAKEEQRLLAVLALGETEIAPLRQRLEKMVFSEGTTQRGRVAQAAVWALSQDGGSAPVLLRALEDGDPELRTYAALGLGDSRLSRTQRRAAIDSLLQVVEGDDSGPVARSASILALGSIARDVPLTARQRTGSSWPRVVETLLDASLAPSTSVKRASLLALAQLSDERPVEQAISQGLLSDRPAIRASATTAAVLLAREKARERFPLLPKELDPAKLSGDEQVKGALDRWTNHLSDEHRYSALIRLEETLVEQARVGLRASSKSAEAILGQLQPTARGIAFGTLLTKDDYSHGSEARRLASAAAERIRRSLQEEIIALASGPHPALARQALGTIVATDSPAAARILAHQLRSPTNELHQAALNSLIRAPSTSSLRLLEPYLQGEGSWGRRRRVATALGSVLASVKDTETQAQVEQLLTRLKSDPSALVRDEASAQLKAGPRRR